MNPGEFEQVLSRRPLKPVPSGWRSEILAAARDAQITRRQPAEMRHSRLATLKLQLSSIFWPHPAAWAGLAAVWVLVMALHFSLSDKPLALAEKAMPPSPAVLAELRQQQRLYAQLMGTTERDADRPRVLAPKPRSQRDEIYAG